MSDNIMPHSYFKTLLPLIRQQLPGINIFYEQKASLSLDNLIILKNAGVNVIQPGIESLSTECLKLINKGTSASQNIALLRYARSIGIALNWNFLYSIPDDKIEYYLKMLKVLPLLRHLHPPASLSPICIVRFSPYFQNYKRYLLNEIKPIESYANILPNTKDAAKTCYFFNAEYTSGSKDNINIINDFNKEIIKWYESWTKRDIPPMLTIAEIEDDKYILIDTRELNGDKKLIQFITHRQTLLILAGFTNNSEEEIKWALENKLVIELDSKYVPLATASPEVLKKFINEYNEYLKCKRSKS